MIVAFVGHSIVVAMCSAAIALGAQPSRSGSARRNVLHAADVGQSPTYLDTANAGSPAANAVPSLPPARLAPIGEFADETARQAAIERQVERLADLAVGSDHVATRTTLKLAQANVMLARLLEPACTRRLLGIAKPDAAANVETTIDRADALIREADALMKQVADAADPTPDWLSAARENHGALRAYSAALRAMLFSDNTPKEPRHDRALRAAAGLSVLLEEADPRIVASASLMQAYLYTETGGADRALAVLELALVPPQRRALRFEFFTRLYRCRVLARRGGHATALALLFQIEERCARWFADQPARGDALRAVTLVELAVLADWHAHLSGLDKSAERAWCVKKMNQCIGERFSGEAATVLRLESAIPILVAPPDEIVPLP